MVIILTSRAPQLSDSPQSVKVYEDSVFRLSKRINFDIGCHLDFRSYPVDQQICRIKIESYGYQAHVRLFTKIDKSDILIPVFRSCTLSGGASVTSTKRSTCQATTITSTWWANFQFHRKKKDLIFDPCMITIELVLGKFQRNRSGS